ncbi:MAG: xanthine dehydrogenase family protein molybdopterin-binding subunit [bacterium]|nr:xanthine dehydrogenase family protein molybdopterin-binding subunit [bacterium]MDE0287488.1 xanthine dehydrogenase family protein molybdopterin-binding subunit [bacterium]MDE0376920.1 xanthine dehydrogenase family protein molybdopterin-binding subunit [bacterium]
MTYVGSPVRRVEDRPLLTGSARFAADLSLPHQLHLRVVRSPVAHGRIVGVDASEALSLPGVEAVWTAADTRDIPVIDFRMPMISGVERYRQPVLADGRVRYVGEPVAVVLAEDPYLAEDAAEQVFVEIDELRPVVDPYRDGARATEIGVVEKAYGDLVAAFAGAPGVVEMEFTVGRHSAIPMETRGALARYDATSSTLEMFGAAKVPHYNREAIARMLGLPTAAVVLREVHVGGGFGVRGELYPEDVLVCWAARRTGRPVRWVEDRREHMLAANHSRDQVHRIRAAVDEDGWVRGVEAEFWVDQGAYLRTHETTVSELTSSMLPGPYVWPAFRCTGHVRLSNKTPCGTYRAPGRYESSFVRERLMDVIARRLELDPAQVRRRNLIPRDAMPFRRGISALGTDVVYDSGDYGLLLDRLLDHLDYEILITEIEARRARGETVGIGMGFFIEKSGLGPYDGVRITVDEAGYVVVVTGAASIGQGVETCLAQICADTLGVGIDAVQVRHGQTDDLVWGMGAFASRVTVMSGSATLIAAGRVRDKALDVAARVLEARLEDLTIEDGRVFVRGSPDGPGITLGEVALRLRPGLADGEPGLAAEGWFEVDHMVYPYGIHVAVVGVDRDTGEVKPERLVVAYDAGRVVNPALVDGQIHGGAAQGLGGALLEEFKYDEAAQPLAASFMDYLMPTADEMPAVDVLITEDAPSPINPLGVKGAGEGGITAVGAAIGNAVADALGCQLEVRRLPLSPDRVRQIVARLAGGDRA